MKEKIKIGYIGLGRRGTHVLQNNVVDMEDVEIAMICDLCEARMKNATALITEKGRPAPIETTDYHDILNNPSIDGVFIMTSWSGRVQIAMESMRAGKYTGIEVGVADDLQECFDLVRTYEETGTPVMMLENCCYGRREMMLLNMVKQGLFGELVHCTGGYQHYLPTEDLFRPVPEEEKDFPHYRLPHYVKENRENYPTHELGPISKIMGINRGNRMVRLTSFASKSAGLKDYATTRFGADSKEANTTYLQGDIVNTVNTCADGATILLTLDTTLPRAYYSRNLSVRGTKGMSSEERKVVFLEGMEEKISNNEAEMFEKYDHPLHAEYVVKGVKDAGHGGMDWLLCRAFVESIKAGINTPIDVYDTATWLAIGPLSEKSIQSGNLPVEIPDFTNGKWQNREPAIACKYSLDVIVKDDTISVV
jgi:hypothetical protein